MCKVEGVAKYIVDKYRKDYGEDIEHMKLHKMLYFAQRESYIEYNEPLFEESLYAGKHGPVVLEVRDLYVAHSFKRQIRHSVLESRKRVFEKLWKDYASSSTLTLRDISCEEISWKNAMDKKDNPVDGFYLIDNNDIKDDALKIIERRKQLSQIPPHVSVNKRTKRMDKKSSL